MAATLVRRLPKRKHVPMYSSGAGSWAASKRVADEHGAENVWLVFADVKGDNPSPHAGEDEDNYRFLVESAADIFGVDLQLGEPSAEHYARAQQAVAADPLGQDDWVPVHARYLYLLDVAAEKLPQLVWLNEGRDIWQVFKDDRFLGNSRLANCSKFLKQRISRAWLEKYCDPTHTTVTVGIDWSEEHRLPAIVKNYLPYAAEAPLCSLPYVDKEQVLQQLRDRHVEPPRLYAMGAAHANCGMFCVRAGQGQFKQLLELMPERYAYHEAKEQELREYLDKDVAILRDRRGGTLTPLTLRSFRERFETKPETIDAHDIGGCGCFVDEGTG